jgi:hypothetical protein
MPEPEGLLLFVLATLTLNVTPGPDMLYVIARAAGQGRSAGVVSASASLRGVWRTPCSSPAGSRGCSAPPRPLSR